MATNDTIFTEFENENRYRNYPFAEHVTCSNVDKTATLSNDIFIDAALYPLNSKGNVYLSEINNENLTLTISDESGIIATGNIDFNSTKIEFYDTTHIHRHVGVLVYNPKYLAGKIAGVLAYGSFGVDDLAFASSVVCPVKNDGVLSLGINNSLVVGDVKFESPSGAGLHVVSEPLSEGKTSIRFDAIPAYSEVSIFSIKKIIFVTTGTTPFRVTRYYTEPDNDNTVVLTLDKISRDIICSGVHRENNYEIADVCEDPIPPGEYTPRPEIDEVLELTPKFNCINIVAADNVPMGYENPVSITFDSESSKSSGSISNSEIISSSDVNDVLSADKDKEGLKIEIPGLNGALNK
jgi:hypothetical protein